MTFEEIYKKNCKLVFNLALQYVQNQEDAEEITQDVFLKVYNSLENFKQEAQISTWVYRITINTSLDYLKARNRKKRFGIFTSIFHNESSELKHDVPNFSHPGIELEHKEEFENLFKKINRLPENQKTALILNKIEQISHIEIAEIMNTSPKAVESLIQRAKTNLEKILK